MIWERKGHCRALQYIIMYTIIGRVLLFCRPRRSSYIRAGAATRREYGLRRHVVIARRIYNIIYSYFYYYCAYITIIYV